MKQRGAMEDPMWRKMFLFFILQFTGALSRDLSLYYAVRAGDDVTLSCENVIDGHSNCDTTTWVYSNAGRPAVELVNHGQVKVTRSNRLSVSANCSLVVKNVTDQDVGRYNCRQFKKPGEGQFGSDAVVRLSLVHLTEHEDQNKITLTCSVVTDEPCKHSVKWLYNGNLLDKDDKEITESSSSCSAAVAFQTSHFIYQSRFNTLKCEVKIENKVQLFTFSSRPSEKDKTTTTSAATTKPDKIQTTEETRVTTKLDGTSAIRMTSTNTPTRDPDGEQPFLWLYITLPLLLVALITILFILLNRARGHKAKQISNDSVTLKPAETQSASENQQQVDPENGVSYASISYTKKSNSSRAKGDDDGEAVTYSTVNSPAVDPSSLYASIK